MALREPQRKSIGQRRHSTKITERRKELFPGSQSNKETDEDITILHSRSSSPLKEIDAEFDTELIGDYIILENIPKLPVVANTINQKVNSMSPVNLMTPADVETPMRKSINMELNTPHDSSGNISLAKSPTKTCHEGIKRKYDLDVSPLGHKEINDEISKSKVRTVLFSTKTERKRTPKKKKSHSLFICGRTRNGRKFGQINAGVRHNIRRPRVKKPSMAHLIEAAKTILDTSVLKEVPKENLEEIKQPEVEIEREREPTPPPDLTKKFFKHAPSKATITLDKTIKMSFSHGKMSFVSKKTQGVKRKLNKVETFTCDEQLIEPSKIDNILGILEDDKENLSSQELHDVILSPTSQMCNMTSGLALNSPTKTCRDLTRVIENSSVDMEKQKLFPIFYGEQAVAHPPKEKKNAPPAKRFKKIAKDQMLLDAGQKNFGAKQCPECLIVYHMGDPTDELMHNRYHNAENIFRFQGWKDERIVSTFPNEMSSRIIQVNGNDSKVWLKRVQDVLNFINRSLGYYEMELQLDKSQIYLYIKNHTIVGCLVAEPQLLGYTLLDSVGVDMCSKESTAISCGVSRIWVAVNHRKQGIATTLLNSLRANFHPGCILNKTKIAFSSPTNEGKLFAAKYFNTPNFLVY